MAVNVQDVIERHGSVRTFTGRPLSEAVVHRLVSLAQRAPTDATGQLYTFVWVRERDLREKVAALAGNQDQVRKAGAFFVVCLDTHRTARLLEHRGERFGMGPLVSLLFGITDAALAAQNLVLAAQADGLGICYIGAVQNHAVKVAELLRLPTGVVPLWGLCVGEPETPPLVRPRLPLDLVLMEDRYREPSDADLDRAFAAMASTTRSGDWLNPIRKYFAENGHMAAREDTLRALLDRQGLAVD